LNSKLSPAPENHKFKQGTHTPDSNISFNDIYNDRGFSFSQPMLSPTSGTAGTLNSKHATPTLKRNSDVASKDMDKRMSSLDMRSSKASYNVNPMAANFNSKLSPAPKNRDDKHGIPAPDASKSSSSTRHTPPPAASGSAATLHSKPDEVRGNSSTVPYNPIARRGNQNLNDQNIYTTDESSIQDAANVVNIVNPIAAAVRDPRSSRNPSDTNTGRTSILNSVISRDRSAWHSVLQRPSSGVLPAKLERLSSEEIFLGSVKHKPPVFRESGAQVPPTTTMQRWMATKVGNRIISAPQSLPAKPDPVPRSRVSSSDSDDSGDNSIANTLPSHSISLSLFHDRVGSGENNDNNNFDDGGYDDVESARK
jgi:hypothetical protein